MVYGPKLYKNKNIKMARPTKLLVNTDIAKSDYFNKESDLVEFIQMNIENFCSDVLFVESYKKL